MTEHNYKQSQKANTKLRTNITTNSQSICQGVIFIQLAVKNSNKI